MERIHPAKDTVIRTDRDLAATLASGQTFAFTANGATPARDNAGGGSGGFAGREYDYSGIVDGRPVRIRALSEGGVPAVSYEIMCAGADADFWTRYFDLESSYDSVLAEFIAKDACGYARGLRYLADCVAAFGGLRLLRQPLWETICAFILSANNHQKRIESLYRRLSERYGDAVRWDGGVFYAFPTPERLAAAAEAEFRALGLGYRAPYMSETARLVAAEGLPDLDALTYEDALKNLTRMKGVGEKVADCVLLFATRHRIAFPVDVWIERALRDIFGMSGTRKALKREAQALFGGAAGLAQQFIFHGVRSNLQADVVIAGLDPQSCITREIPDQVRDDRMVRS